MSIWIAHVPAERLPGPDIMGQGAESRVHMPFDEWPDVTGLHSSGELRQRLKTLHPESTPEAIARMTERLWTYVHAVHAEDIIVFPLPESGEACFAQATSRVRFEDGRYVLPVKWYDRRAKLSQFRRDADMFVNNGLLLREVTGQQLKSSIRDRLPLPGNRFRGWKWLVGVLVLLQVLRMASRMLHNQGAGF